MKVEHNDSDLVFIIFSPPFGMPARAAQHWIEVFKRERNHALLRSPAQWAQHVAMWHSRDLDKYEAEVSFHQTRTAVVTIGMAYRRISYEWLTQRGLDTFEDSGTITPPALDADDYTQDDAVKAAVVMTAGQCCGGACGKVVLAMHDKDDMIFSIGTMHYDKMRHFAEAILQVCSVVEAKWIKSGQAPLSTSGAPKKGTAQ